MMRPPDHDEARDVARGSAAMDDEAHIAAHELGHDTEAAIDLVDELAAARDHGDEAAVDLYLQRLRRALQRLRQDTDRLVAGRGGHLATVQRQPTNLATLVRRVVSAHPSGRHPIDTNLASVVLNVDPLKVERVVDNLLHNALRHTPPHCPVEIDLRAALVGALVVVEDEGPGLPDHLCDALARDSDDPDAFAGAVGLWLVRRFARLHGGDLSVEPNVHGRPARFEVWLPARGGRPAGPAQPTAVGMLATPPVHIRGLPLREGRFGGAGSAIHTAGDPNAATEDDVHGDHHLSGVR